MNTKCGASSPPSMVEICGWVIPARRATSDCDRLSAARRSYTACPRAKAYPAST
ncbi:hypothetical protein K7862_30405 [Streptomyces sp. PLK6-54]|uniref:Uncharacterized protein n=1 Tax=Actinacidiphila acidipaludis TaxID=2873382 RepID=A0ABS7QG37_9ACTN|nr:hypothetical protein [Streptomyces acidipaludis]